MKYIEEYIQASNPNQCAQIWKELQDQGRLYESEELYADALAVACETMKRVRANVEVLVDRLKKCDYTFAFPNEIITPPNSNISDRIAELEMLVGRIPLSIRACYEIVGGVNLMGDHPLLSCYYDLYPDETWDPAYSDPLVIDPIDGAFIDYNDLCDDDENEPNWKESFVIPISPDEGHKSNISSAGAYEL